MLILSSFQLTLLRNPLDPRVLSYFCLTKQHVQLVQMNKRFRQSLEGIVHEEVLRRDEVEVQGRELVKALREHLELEETEAFPLARERLSASDWEELFAGTSGEEDPLFSSADQERFQSLLRHLTEQDGT